MGWCGIGAGVRRGRSDYSVDGELGGRLRGFRKLYQGPLSSVLCCEERWGPGVFRCWGDEGHNFRAS